MQQNSNTIEDDRLKPYFLKLVNSSYEVHQNHVPKDVEKKPYTKFVCVKDSIKGALGTIVKLKLETKRRTKKTLMLVDYLSELREMEGLVEQLLDDDSPERKLKALRKEIIVLNSRISKLEERLIPQDAFKKTVSQYDGTVSVDFKF